MYFILWCQRLWDFLYLLCKFHPPQIPSILSYDSPPSAVLSPSICDLSVAWHCSYGQWAAEFNFYEQTTSNCPIHSHHFYSYLLFPFCLITLLIWDFSALWNRYFIRNRSNVELLLTYLLKTHYKIDNEVTCKKNQSVQIHMWRRYLCFSVNFQKESI